MAYITSQHLAERPKIFHGTEAQKSTNNRERRKKFEGTEFFFSRDIGDTKESIVRQEAATGIAKLI